MRIKVLNLPRLHGFVWAEVVAGFSFVVGVGITLTPF